MNKLNIKPSNDKPSLSFNDWVKELNVSRCYVEPTKYFEGNNPNWSMEPIGVCRYLYENEVERFIRVSRIYLRKLFSLFR